MRAAPAAATGPGQAASAALNAAALPGALQAGASSADSSTAGDVHATAQALRAQVAQLGKQLDAFYNRADGQGIAPPLPSPLQRSRAGSDASATAAFPPQPPAFAALSTLQVPSAHHHHRPPGPNTAPRTPPPMSSTLTSMLSHTGRSGSAFAVPAGGLQPPLPYPSSSQAAASLHALHTAAAAAAAASKAAGHAGALHTAASAATSGVGGATFGQAPPHQPPAYQIPAGLRGTQPYPAPPPPAISVGALPRPASGHLHSAGAGLAPRPLGAAHASLGYAGTQHLPPTYGSPHHHQHQQAASASRLYPQHHLYAQHYAQEAEDELLAAHASASQSRAQLAAAGAGARAAGAGAHTAALLLAQQQQQAQQQQAVVGGKEEARLKEMLQEVRHERRRLEDKILSGDSQGIRLQELRDELERQVGALSRQRDVLEAETGGMALARDTATAAEHEALLLREELAAEQHLTAQLHGLKGETEQRLAELSASIETLSVQHTQVVAGLSAERDALSGKLAKALSKLTKAEGELAAARAELDATRQELHARELSLAEVRTSAEVLQAASAQMQSQLGSSKRELESRCLELSRQLEEARHEVVQASSGAASSQQALQDATSQLKESLTRTDFLRHEREKLVKVLQAEQAALAEARKELDAARAQAAAAEASRAEVEALFRQQIEGLTRENEARVASVTKQFEAQLAAAEKAASAAARQYDSSVTSGQKLLEVHTGLRRERDELWSELDGARAELASVQQERDQLASKVQVLRAEVKATMDDVRSDRDARLAASASQHEAALVQLRAQYEGQAAAVARETEAQTTGLLEMVERLKRELDEVHRSSDRQRQASALLKDQLAQALVLRDNLERELVQERAYGEELGRLLGELKGGAAGVPLRHALRHQHF